MRRRGASPAPPAAAEPVVAVDLPLPRARSGKVRECFDAGDRLLLVATDRISAFDCVFARGIPGKGRVLTGISRFWFAKLDAGAAGPPPIEHHLLDAEAEAIVAELALPPQTEPLLRGRTMLVQKARPVPFECVVRAYLDGSALEEYGRTGSVSGERLPPGLRRGDRLRRPLFTPALKALAGHDENVTFDEMSAALGGPLAERLRELSLRLYAMGSEALARRGLLLADTKFEVGLVDQHAGPGPERVLLIDELLTPDSSRIWEAEAWQPGRAQPSFDKQPLRDYLEDLVKDGRWNKRPPPPELPHEVVEETAARYARAYLRITGAPLPDGPAAVGVAPVARRGRGIPEARPQP